MIIGDYFNFREVPMTIVLYTTGAAMLSYLLVMTAKHQLAAERAQAGRVSSRGRTHTGVRRQAR